MRPLQNIASGMTALKQLVSLVVLAAAGIVSVTLLFTQVDANEERTQTNMEQIEELKASLQDITLQQGVIITEMEGEKERNKEFRDRTDRSLDRILDRLTPRSGTGLNR